MRLSRECAKVEALLKCATDMRKLSGDFVQLASKAFVVARQRFQQHSSSATEFDATCHAAKRQILLVSDVCFATCRMLRDACAECAQRPPTATFPWDAASASLFERVSRSSLRHASMIDVVTQKICAWFDAPPTANRLTEAFDEAEFSVQLSTVLHAAIMDAIAIEELGELLCISKSLA